MLSSQIRRVASLSSHWWSRGGVALVLVSAALLATPTLHSASAASCVEGAQQTVTSTIPNPSGPGVATQQKTYQCVGGRYVLVATLITSRVVGTSAPAIQPPGYRVAATDNNASAQVLANG
jgi:hypothetical protein